MVIRELISETAQRLNENAAFEARQIVMAAAGMNNTEIVLKSKTKVSEDVIKCAFGMAQRRIKGEPLQYIIGMVEFMGLTFRVDKNVLIPRADTEILVETVLNIIGNRSVNVLDIGTGSGCIGISIAKLNKNASVTFLDISENALLTAKKNADLNGVFGEFVKMDILKECPNKKFELIVSNPPYIRADVIPTLQTEVKDYEPYGALCGGTDGLAFYRRITDIVPQIMEKSGVLAFEIGYDQGKDVLNIMTGFKDVHLIKDYAGNDRVIIGVWDKVST